MHTSCAIHYGMVKVLKSIERRLHINNSYETAPKQQQFASHFSTPPSSWLDRAAAGGTAGTPPVAEVSWMNSDMRGRYLKLRVVEAREAASNDGDLEDRVDVALVDQDVRVHGAPRSVGTPRSDFGL